MLIGALAPIRIECLLAITAYIYIYMYNYMCEGLYVYIISIYIYMPSDHRFFYTVLRRGKPYCLGPAVGPSAYQIGEPCWGVVERGDLVFTPWESWIGRNSRSPWGRAGLGCGIRRVEDGLPLPAHTGEAHPALPLWTPVCARGAGGRLGSP